MRKSFEKPGAKNENKANVISKKKDVQTKTKKRKVSGR